MISCEATPVFFPEKQNEQLVIDFINEAKKELKICVYTFTNQNIAMAILKKVTDDKVRVRIITDDMQNAGAYSIVNVLQSASNNLIQCRTDLGKGALMHHKYVIIDDSLLATGSFNWTAAAVNKNQENLLLIRSPKLAKEYSDNFEQLWTQFKSTEQNLSKLSSKIKDRGAVLKQKLKTSKADAKKQPKTLPVNNNSVTTAAVSPAPKSKRIQKKKVSLIRPTNRRNYRKKQPDVAIVDVPAPPNSFFSKFRFPAIANKIISACALFAGSYFYFNSFFNSNDNSLSQ